MAKNDFTAFLGAETVYEGLLSFSGTMHIDGQFSGEINSEGNLFIGRGARVAGLIRVGTLVVSGNIQGEMIVSEKTTLHKSAIVCGKLTSKSLIVEDGASIEGNLCTGEAMIAQSKAAEEKAALPAKPQAQIEIQ